MIIRTPDQRLRVFVSSTLQEMAEERAAAREAINRLRLSPVMFEIGARPHPPQALYRSYLDQSHIFIGLYWERYGWVAPDMTISGLEDEYRLCGDKPKLIYIKSPAPNREPRLKQLLDDIRNDDSVSYKSFNSAAELQQLIENDLAIMLTERFEMTQQAPDAGALPAHYNNLPASSTPLIGRNDEIARVADLLLRGDVRLVTLHGPGGIGKTRLAIEAGRRALNHFTHGVCFVPLSSITDHNLVIPAIGAALGLGETRAAGLTERVIDTLREKHLLLILDNFEQVMPAATAIAELLAAAPKIEMIVTSRTVLHVRGEHECPVLPLELPPQRDALTHEQIKRSAAVQLFVERAKAVKADFDLTPANAQAVAGIVAHLDGLPLAIELAAARVKLLSPQAILPKLIDAGQGARLLSGGARDLPERQQTLLNTLAWSYGLLTADEQRWFERVSVFVDGWTLDAVTPVCEFEDVFAAMDAMSSLADKSLIMHMRAADDTERFSMLNTLRDYAALKLAARGESDHVAGRHAAHFAQLALQSEQQIVGAGQKEWLAKLDAENSNIQSALNFLIDKGDAVSAANAGWALRAYWLITTRQSESLRWMTAALSRLDTAPDAEGHVDPQKIQARAKALSVAGFSAAWQGNADWAGFLLADAEHISQQSPNPHIMAMVHTGHAIAALSSKDLATSQAHFEHSLASYREAGDAWSALMVLNGLLRVAGLRCDFETSDRVYRDLQAMLPSLSDQVSVAVATCEMGFVSLQRGDFALAEKQLREAIVMCRDAGYREGVIWSLESLSAAAHQAGNALRAATLFGAASTLRDLAGIPVWHQAEGTDLSLLKQAIMKQTPQQFEAAFASGAAMALEQAVSYAIT
jgi:predicted ATPase